MDFFGMSDKEDLTYRKRLPKNYIKAVDILKIVTQTHFKRSKILPLRLISNNLVL